MDSKTISRRRQILAHDTDGLKNLWEKKIEKQTVEHQVEDARRHKSALSKLREEWRQRLEFRLNMLQSLQEEQRKQFYGKDPGDKANTAA
ncbi:protein FAM240B-like [Ranitomeya variabilis]|uniref:protein FAM240B-like n=1 Tax=Ranitomeya variabilis TaxID=490064 RepID=UPI0040564643